MKTCSPLLLLAILAASSYSAPGQAPTIGILFWHDSPNDLAAFAGIREGLEATGRPFRLIERRAGSNRGLAVVHLADFQKRRVDVVVALGTEATHIAAAHLKGIPLVFTAVTDPVASGIVPSWRGSGSFIAGNSNHINPDRVLTEFRRAIPGLKTLGVLHSPENRVSRTEIQGMQETLKRRASLGIRLLARAIPDPRKLAAVTEEILAESDALWIPIDYGIYSNLEAVAAVARKLKKPIVTTTRKAVPHAVVAVLPDYHTLGMLAVEIIDRILRRGVEPGAIPVGVMQGHILVVNLKAANLVGLEVPISALAVADRIVSERKARDRDN